MKADLDNVCQVTTGFGKRHAFEYYVDTFRAEYEVRRNWLRTNIGIFGEHYYYHQGRWWFKTSEDLLAFELRFKND